MQRSRDELSNKLNLNLIIKRVELIKTIFVNIFFLYNC